MRVLPGAQRDREPRGEAERTPKSTSNEMQTTLTDDLRIVVKHLD